MDAAVLIEQIEQIRSRAEVLELGGAPDPTAALDEALEEVHNSLEELQAVSDELLRQHEIILSVQTEADRERGRYKELFELSPDGYIVTDAHGVIVEANRAAASMLGMRHSFIPGHSLSLFLEPEDRVRLNQLQSRVDRLFSPREMHVSIKRHAGEPFTVAMRVGLVRGRDGEFAGFRLSLRDNEPSPAETDIEADVDYRIESAVLARTAHLEEQNRLKDELLMREQMARGEAEAAHRRLSFLCEASEALGSSLDYAETLAHLARLVVPFLADWCVIDTVEDDGSVRRMAVVHADPARSHFAMQLQDRYPARDGLPHGVPQALRTGEPELKVEVTDTDLQEAAADEQHLRLLRALGMRSFLCVPLVCAGRIYGAITLVAGDSGRHFNMGDLSLAEDLARRAAAAVANARRHRSTNVELTVHRKMEEALARKQAEVQNLNRELQQAMRETHHRVKNNLQTIAAMVDMQVLEKPDGHPTEDLRRLASSVRALAAVHDILTRQAGEDSTAEHVSVQSVLERMLPMLRASAGTRQLDFDADDIHVTSKQATAFALIVNELVSNAIKHGRGEVRVELRVSAGSLALTVDDGGDGFPPNFEVAAAANTGLDLVEHLARWDLGGQIRYHRSASGGARVEVRVPAEPASGSFPIAGDRRGN